MSEALPNAFAGKPRRATLTSVVCEQALEAPAATSTFSERCSPASQSRIFDSPRPSTARTHSRPSRPKKGSGFGKKQGVLCTAFVRGVICDQRLNYKGFPRYTRAFRPFRFNQQLALFPFSLLRLNRMVTEI